MNRKEAVGFSIDKKTRDKIGEICRQKGYVLSEVIQSLIQDFIRKYENNEGRIDFILKSYEHTNFYKNARRELSIRVLKEPIYIPINANDED